MKPALLILTFAAIAIGFAGCESKPTSQPPLSPLEYANFPVKCRDGMGAAPSGSFWETQTGTTREGDGTNLNNNVTSSTNLCAFA